MAAHKRGHRKRRDRYTTDRKLAGPGRIQVTEPVPATPWRRWMSPKLARFFGILPAVEASVAGRAQGRVMKGVLGGIALFIIWKWRQQFSVGLLAIPVALLATVLPVTEGRRHRLVKWAKGLSQGGERPVSASAELTWNGARLVIKHEGLQWRSMRPFATPHTLVTKLHSDGVLGLRLLAAQGKTPRPIWITGPADGMPEDAPAPRSVEEAGPIIDAIAVDAALFRLLHRALVEPGKRA